MVDHMRFTLENRSRILAVESSFGPAGKSLLAADRVLVGEGRLTKLCRRRPQPKAFFLFNDILVYGSIVVPGRWNNHQQILRLEEVHQEDLQDGMGMANQWLLRTPRKSFHVAASSAEEKRAWMEHIEQCRAQQLMRLGLPAEAPHAKDFAAIWIPDQASAICMRCCQRFSVGLRRHHCRRCGFVVCSGCSKGRAVLRHIGAKPVRVCVLCKTSLQKQEEEEQRQGQRQGQRQAWKCNSMEDTPEYDSSSDEEVDEVGVATQSFRSQNKSLAIYCYLNLDHIKPPLPLKQEY